MALDKQLADKLWNSRYESYLKGIAQKNRYLHDTKDPDDLFQDLAINVWMKAVKYFDADKSNYASGDVERTFNAFVSQIMGQYLASLSAHRDTGKQQWNRSVDSADTPLNSKDGGDAKETILNRVADAADDPELSLDLQRIIHSLPEDLSWAVQYIIEHADAGNITQVMKDIRAKYPQLTPTRLLNGLTEEPEFMDFITSI